MRLTVIRSHTLLAFLVAAPLVAQRVPVQAPTATATAATAANAGAPPARADKRALTIPEYGRWRSITGAALSDDGTWAAWGYSQRNVDDTLFVKHLGTGTATAIPRASGAQFSDDGKWVAYFVAAPGANRAGRGGGGGAGGRGGDNGAADGPRRAELRDLGTGQVRGWENAQSFAFNKGSTVLLVRKARPQGAGGAAAVAAPAAVGGGGRGGNVAAAPAQTGTDLILHRLADDSDQLIGGVTAAEFNRPGTILAFTTGTADRDGNGLSVVMLVTRAQRTLDNVRADYARLTWDSAGTALAALRGMDKRGYAEKENAVVVVTGLDAAQPQVTVLGPTELAGLAANTVISEKGALTWSPDRSRLFVGLRENEARPVPARRDSTVDEEPVANVDVWHWKDDVIQPVQMVRAPQEQNRTFVAALFVAQKKIVPLADARMQTVQISRDGAWGIGRDDKDYIDDWKPQLADYYRVNTGTGERAPVLKGLERALGLSPDGRFWLYWKDRQVWAYDIAKGTHANITRVAPVSFVNVEEDHFGEKPAYGVAGFTKDGKSVVLDHKFDLWLVSLDGSAPARNLTGATGATGAAGARKDLRLRYEQLEPADAAAPGQAVPGGGGGGRGGGGGSNVIDLSRPVTLTAFNERDKKAGFYTLDGDKLTPLVYEDRAFGRPIKARNADRVLVTRETFVEFPDLWVTDTKFSKFAALTNANPQQAEYRWGRRVLIDYKDRDGHPLQGTLAIPDDWKPGQRLPMLIYYYEKLSQQQNRYEAPRYASGPQYADYVSNGYLVLLPDVYYHTGKTHTDMKESLEAAIKRVVDLGYADPKRVGLHGGSFSGQGGAYLATTSKAFAAIAIRAAAVDLVADFNQLWKTSGTSQHRFDVYGQGRFGTNPFDNLELYMDQSALFHAKTMDTPLLILQGTNDGSTEWLQGVEFYNALRFLKKPVIFLSYEGEAHGFTRYENQYDFMMRLHQFYDHHLKGLSAAEWITNGVPFLKKKAPTGQAAQPVQLMGGGAGIGTPGTGVAAGGAGGRGGPPPQH